MFKKLVLVLSVLFCAVLVYPFGGGSSFTMNQNLGTGDSPIFNNITLTGGGAIGTYLRVGTTLDVAGTSTFVSSVTVKAAALITGTVDLTGTALNMTNAATPTLTLTDTTNSAAFAVYMGNTVGGVGTITDHTYDFLQNNLSKMRLTADDLLRISPNGNLLNSTTFYDGGLDVAGNSKASNNIVAGSNISATSLNVSSAVVKGNGGLQVVDQTTTKFINCTSTSTFAGTATYTAQNTNFNNAAATFNLGEGHAVKGSNSEHALMFCPLYKKVFITDFDNISKAHNRATPSNPTLFVFAYNNPENNAGSQFGSFSHDGEYFRIPCGSGTTGGMILNPSSASGADSRLYVTTNTATGGWQIPNSITIGTYIQLASKTIAELKVITPTAVGQAYYCSDSTPPSVYISTGTGQYGFVKIAGGDTD